MKAKILSTLFFLGLQAFLSSCTQELVDVGPNGEAVSQKASYSVMGNQFITTRNIIGNYCEGDSLITGSDRSLIDTFGFKISGDTLSQITQDTLTSGAVVNRMLNSQRIGTGTGLLGSWKVMGFSYDIVDGEPSPNEEANLMSDAALYSKVLLYQNILYTFLEKDMYYTVDVKSAEEFIAAWNGNDFPTDYPDSAQYDVTVEKVDQYTVKLTGRINGEAVTVSEFQNGDRIQSSSDSTHKTNHYYGVAKSCPNTYEADWYQSFLNANIKAPMPAMKRSSAQITSYKPRFSKLFPGISR